MNEHYTETIVISLAIISLFLALFQTNVDIDHRVAIAVSSIPFTVISDNFGLRLPDGGPVLGKVVVGKPVVISMTAHKVGNTQESNATFVIQVLDKGESAVRIQTTVVKLPDDKPVDISSSWVPTKAGSYTIQGFLLSGEAINKAQLTPLTEKESIDIKVVGESNVYYNRNFTKVYTFCEQGCDYSSLQKAIDDSHAPDEKIVVKDGDYLFRKTIRLWSHTTLEFSDRANITFSGPSGSAVFRGNNIENIMILNPHIFTSNSGIKAFSFSSTNRINVTQGEISLLKGENSTGFYCRDCMNVLISGVSMSSASRLVDIKTSSDINDGNSSNIWIQDGSFASSSIEAIKVNYSNNVFILNNDISDSSNNAIDIGYNFHSIIRNNTIENGGIPNGSGIHTDSATDALISGNTIDGSGKSGVIVYRASQINVLNNTITRPNQNGIAVISALEPSLNVKVNNNQIEYPLEHGIFVSSNQQFVQIHGNKISHVNRDMTAIEIGDDVILVDLDHNVIM